MMYIFKEFVSWLVVGVVFILLTPLLALGLVIILVGWVYSLFKK